MLFKDVPVTTNFREESDGSLYMKCETFDLEEGGCLNAVGLDDGDFYQFPYDYDVLCLSLAGTTRSLET